MLNAPAPFPEVGSWALHDREGETVAARIVSLSLDRRRAGISYPDRPTASGATEVDVAALLDVTPLTADEAAEAEALSVHLSKLVDPKRSTKKVDRYEALWLRTYRLGLLVEQLGRVNRTRLATRATREAHRLFEAALGKAERKRAA